MKKLLFATALLSFVVLPVAAEAGRYGGGFRGGGFKSTPSYKSTPRVPRTTPKATPSKSPKATPSKSNKADAKKPAPKKPDTKKPDTTTKKQPTKLASSTPVTRSSYADQRAGGGFWSNPFVWVAAYFIFFGGDNNEAQAAEVVEEKK